MPPTARTPPPPPRRHLAAVPDDQAQRRAAVVDRLRARMAAGDVRPVDGMVWLAHLDAEGTARLFSRVCDPVDDLDELYVLDLLSTLDAIGLPAVTVAIWRASGQPIAVDRRLARDVTHRLAAEAQTRLDAVVVVNADGHRSVRPSRANPRSRRDRQPEPATGRGEHRAGGRQHRQPEPARETGAGQ